HCFIIYSAILRKYIYLTNFNNLKALRARLQTIILYICNIIDYFMKLKYLFALLAIATLIGFYSCEKDDDEPPASNSISRLYISYSDFNENPDLTQFNNVVLLPNSDDEENMGLRATPFLSNVKGGNTIYFNPSARLIFQSSINTTVTDTFVYRLNIGETGALSNDN